MTEADLRNIITARPEVRNLGLEAAEVARAVNVVIPVALNEVVVSYDWDFAAKIKDVTTTATQEYTFSGDNRDCRDIINVRYGDTGGGWTLLKKMRPVDMDNFLSGRTVSGVGWWVPHGFDGDNFPKIKVYMATAAGKTLRYRYRRNNVKIEQFPDGFGFVLISAAMKELFPMYLPVYEKDLKRMIDHYRMPGGEDMRASLDPIWLDRNNERATYFGYN